MSELILIRHGESRGNRNRGIIQGSGPDPENTLTDDGKAQARRLGETLARLQIVPAGVWSSPLPRARQTCNIALDAMGCELPVQEDERLSEMCKGLAGLPGGMEGRAREIVETAEYWDEYRRVGWDFRHGSVESQGETAREVGRRMLAATNDIADALEGCTAPGLVFTHGQAIRFDVGAMTGSGNDWPDIGYINQEYLLGNCDGIVAQRERGTWQVAGRLICDV